jgi:hypothetical protein
VDVVKYAPGMGKPIGVLKSLRRPAALIRLAISAIPLPLFIPTRSASGRSSS